MMVDTALVSFFGFGMTFGADGYMPKKSRAEAQLLSLFSRNRKYLGLPSFHEISNFGSCFSNHTKGWRADLECSDRKIAIQWFGAVEDKEVVAGGSMNNEIALEAEPVLLLCNQISLGHIPFLG